jgi:hypothetical protein
VKEVAEAYGGQGGNCFEFSSMLVGSSGVALQDHLIQDDLAKASPVVNMYNRYGAAFEMQRPELLGTDYRFFSRKSPGRKGMKPHPVAGVLLGLVLRVAMPRAVGSALFLARCLRPRGRRRIIPVPPQIHALGG